MESLSLSQKKIVSFQSQEHHKASKIQKEKKSLVSTTRMNLSQVMMKMERKSLVKRIKMKMEHQISVMIKTTNQFQEQQKKNQSQNLLLLIYLTRMVKRSLESTATVCPMSVKINSVMTNWLTSMKKMTEHLTLVTPKMESPSSDSKKINKNPSSASPLTFVTKTETRLSVSMKNSNQSQVSTRMVTTYLAPLTSMTMANPSWATIRMASQSIALTRSPSQRWVRSLI